MKSFFNFNEEKNSFKDNLGFLGKVNFFKFINGNDNHTKQLNPKRKRLKSIIIFSIIILLGIFMIYSFSLKAQSQDFKNSNQLMADLSFDNAGKINNTALSGGADLIIKLIVGLVLVSCLIYITVYLLRYFYNKKNNLVNANASNLNCNLIEVLESKNLDINKKLFLIQISGKILLLSTTDNQVNLLYELKEEEAQKIILKADSINDTLNKPNFKSFFSKLINN